MSHSSKRPLSRDGSFLRTLLSLFLVFAMVAQSYHGYAQLIGDGKVITITAGQTLVLTRPVEPVVPPPPAPVTITAATTAASLLVQKAAFGYEWYSTGIETAVIDALLTAHSLPPGDRSRLLRWERNTVRAALWNRVVEIIKKSPASRTANEQAVYVAVTLGLKNARIACAQASLDEYNKWDGNAYGYVPPAPFVWRLQPRGSISNFLVPPSVPSFEQFQQYGAAVVYADFQNDAAVQLIAAETARSIQVLGSMVASGIVGGIAGSALGGALGPTVLAEIVAAVLPYAIRTFGLAIAGSTTFGGPIGIVISAIVGIVFQGIAVADANALPGKLAEALTNMQAATIDLAAVAATATGLQELYAVFVRATSPDFAATEPAPPAVAADSQWLVSPSGLNFFRPSPTIQCLDFDSNPQSVRLVDGWFVLRNAAGQERMKLTVEFLSAYGEQATLTRMGSTFFCTDATANFSACLQGTLFQYRDWNGTARAAKLGSGGAQAAIANASLAAGAVGQAYSQTLTVTSGGPGTYTFAVPTDSVLPTGLTLSAGGVLSGTPRSAGTFSFEIYASNSPTNSHPAITRFTVSIIGSLAPTPAGLVAAWRFSDSPQDSVGNNHGTWVNTPAYTDGKVGRAATFDFTDYVALPDNVFPTGDRTFETWFRTSGFGGILGQFDAGGPGYVPAVYVGLDGKLRVSFFYNGAATPFTSAASVNDGLWHHMAVTHTGTLQRIYLDGVEIGARQFTSVAYATNYAYTLGFARALNWPGWNGDGMPFSGQIDETAIYNQALTSNEIAAIYAAGSTGRSALTLGALAASTGTVGTFLTDTITVQDGATSLTATAEYSVVSGALPFGLQIGAGGVLSGVPHSAGTFAFTLRAKGADSHFGERIYSIAIAGPVQAIPDGLVAWWRAEVPNQFASLPGNLHPLALASGSVPIVSGYVGSGFGLGTGTLLVPSGVLPTDGSPFSFEAWIRTSTGGTLLHRRRSVSAAEPAISVGADGLVRSQLFWNAGAPPIVSVVPVNDGNWHHLAASYAGGEERLYLDGQIAGILRGLSVPAGVSATYRIGGNDSGGDAFAGQLDEAAVYSRAITVAEVAGVFTGGGVGKSALVLNPTTLPVGYVGQAYQQTLTSPSLLTPGDFARTYSIASGALPPGITLTAAGSAAGVLSGVPVTSGAWTATIVANDGSNQGARTYSIRVFGVPSQIPGGAVAWWRGELNPNDSVGTLHATLLGSAGYAAGISGNGFRFDGSGARVLLPATSFPSPATAPTAPFTFETWFQTRTPGVILGREDQDFPLLPFYYVPAIYVGTDGRLRAQLFWSGSVNPLTSAGRVDDGQPHHVAVTFASGVQQLFLDGALIGTRSGFTQIHNSLINGYRYQLGTGYTLGWPAGNSYWLHFNGLIDEPATYSRALTAAEILAIYTGGDAGKTSVAPTSATLTSGRVGENFIASVFAANSGVAAVLLSGGQLPPGLALSSSGVLSGLPLTAGTFTFNTAAQLSSGAWLLKNLTLRIDGTVAPNLATTGWYSGQNNLNGHAGETASAQNGVAYAAGRVGAAFSFDGSARWLSIFSVPFPAPGGAWSFETWFRTSLPGGIIGQIALSGGGAVPMLYVGTDGLLHAEPYWRGTATTLTSTARVDDGLFHHAAVTYANGVRRLYLDGTLVATQTAAGLSYGSGTYQFNVGRSVTTGWPAAPATSYFTGQIDEVQFIGREITATEVRAVFAAGDLGKSRLSLDDVLADSPANGNEYSAYVTASGGTGPFTYRLASGRFPVGFTLGSAFGEISGVTNVTGTFDFSIEATSAAGEKGVRDYRIVVNPDRRYRAAGLRAWWQAEGNGADWNSVNAATLQGATFATGVVGQGFSFDGTDDRVELPASAFPTPGVNEAFSFETWFRCEDVGVILGQTSTLSNDTPVAGYVPLIYVGSDGRLRAQIIWTGTNNPIVSPGIVGDGTWHHVAATYDGAGTLQVFLDAQLIGTRTGVSSVSYASSYRYFLGRGFTTAWPAATAGWFYFLGEIDEASTWTRALTAAEIRMLAACGTARKADRRITPAGTLPGGVRGRYYQQALATSGESLPTYSIASGSLPPGIVASESIPGAPVRGIYGAPTAAGQFDFILSDYDATQIVDESFRLTIAPLTNNAAYDLWIGPAGYLGANALPGASPRSDLANLLKFAFKLDPNASDVSTLTPGTGTFGLPVFSIIGTGPGTVFRCEYIRRKNAGLTYTAQATGDLQTFAPMGGATTVTSIDAQWERVIQDVPATERKFGRVLIEMN